MELMAEHKPTAVDQQMARQYASRGLTEESQDLLQWCGPNYYGGEHHGRRTNGSCRCGLYIADNKRRYVSIWNWVLSSSNLTPVTYATEEPMRDVYEWSCILETMRHMDQQTEMIPQGNNTFKAIQSNGTFYEYLLSDCEMVHVVIDHWGRVHRVMLTEVIESE